MTNQPGPQARQARTGVCFCQSPNGGACASSLPAAFPPEIVPLFQRLARHDPASAGHALRVCRYACRLATELDLPGVQRRHLFLAAWLHDIGKIYLSPAILQKPKALDAEEYLRVQEHPVLGEHLVAPTIRDPAVRSAIRSHHERWDGAGYPDGLRGRRIPLLARILTIADCFDAMTSPRPYRRAMAPVEAMDGLEEVAGAQVDAELLSVFRRVVTARRDNIEDCASNATSQRAAGFTPAVRPAARRG